MGLLIKLFSALHFDDTNITCIDFLQKSKLKKTLASGFNEEIVQKLALGHNFFNKC